MHHQSLMKKPPPQSPSLLVPYHVKTARYWHTSLRVRLPHHHLSRNSIHLQRADNPCLREVVGQHADGRAWKPHVDKRPALPLPAGIAARSCTMGRQRRLKRPGGSHPDEKAVALRHNAAWNRSNEFLVQVPALWGRRSGRANQFYHRVTPLVRT
jgi:hypothetical protein